jgi:hypothetical protein
VFAALDMLELATAEQMLAGAAEADDAIVRLVMGIPARAGSEIIRSEGAGFLLCETRTHAQARNAKILASVRFRAHTRGSLDALFSLVPKPRNKALSRVLVAAPSLQLQCSLGSSAWSNVSAVDISQRSGFHEAIGGIAYAAAVGLLADGGVREVLVVTHSEESAYALLLAHPEA